MSPQDRLFLAGQYLLPHRLVTGVFGLAAECRYPAYKNWMIDRFIRKYGVDMSESAIQDSHAFEHFNAFFTRALKPGARPLDATPGAILSPADGAVSQLGRVREGRVFQAKGHDYSVTELLGGSERRAAPFAGGDFATIYLAPKDYHRVHMPVTGTLRETIYIPGRQFSVNPLTASNVHALFARNERLVCMFDTEYGPVAVVLVGAMIVAGIETVWGGRAGPASGTVHTQTFGPHAEAPITLQKGDELGRFKLGSTVIMLFGAGQVAWPTTPTALGPVKMGQALSLASV